MCFGHRNKLHTGWASACGLTRVGPASVCGKEREWPLLAPPGRWRYRHWSPDWVTVPGAARRHSTQLRNQRAFSSGHSGVFVWVFRKRWNWLMINSQQLLVWWSQPKYSICNNTVDLILPLEETRWPREWGRSHSSPHGDKPLINVKG